MFDERRGMKEFSKLVFSCNQSKKTLGDLMNFDINCNYLCWVK